jgi:hypothetical protein
VYTQTPRSASSTWIQQGCHCCSCLVRKAIAHTGTSHRVAGTTGTHCWLTHSPFGVVRSGLHVAHCELIRLLSCKAVCPWSRVGCTKPAQGQLYNTVRSESFVSGRRSGVPVSRALASQQLHLYVTVSWRMQLPLYVCGIVGRGAKHPPVIVRGACADRHAGRSVQGGQQAINSKGCKWSITLHAAQSSARPLPPILAPRQQLNSWTTLQEASVA